MEKKNSFHKKISNYLFLAAKQIYNNDLQKKKPVESFHYWKFDEDSFWQMVTFFSIPFIENPLIRFFFNF